MAAIVVMVLSKCMRDRWQILIGLALELFGYSWLIAFVGAGNSESQLCFHVQLYVHFTVISIVYIAVIITLTPFYCTWMIEAM